MPLRKLAALTALTIAVASCDALTSHVDTVARAGSQQLTATRLAELMAGANVPPRKDVALAITNLWVNYQLLGHAAARGDTLNDVRLIDDAMWAQIAQRKSQKFSELMASRFKAPDAAALEKAYNDGEVYAARHILISANRDSLKPAQIEAARRTADNVRKQVTDANFVAMVKKYSGDPGAKQNDGEYVFPKGMMVPEFEKGTAALKLGETSQPIQSQFGFHIIRRETYAEVKAKFDPMYTQAARQKADSMFLDNIVSKAKVEVKPGAGKLIKEMAQDVDRYRNDRTVIATSNKLDLRAGRVAHWIAAMPPQAQIRQQIERAPDSLVAGLASSLMQNELVLKAADSAKIGVDSQEMGAIRASFRGSLANTLAGLNLTPSKLADSAKSVSEREQLAAKRVNEYLEKLLKNQAQFIDVSEPVSLALRRKYEPRVTPASVDQAVTQIAGIKAKADSALNATLPKSVVPMPGAPTPAPAAAPPATPPKPDPAKKP